MSMEEKCGWFAILATMTAGVSVTIVYYFNLSWKFDLGHLLYDGTQAAFGYGLAKIMSMKK